MTKGQFFVSKLERMGRGREELKNFLLNTTSIWNGGGIWKRGREAM